MYTKVVNTYIYYNDCNFYNQLILDSCDENKKHRVIAYANDCDDIPRFSSVVGLW